MARCIAALTLLVPLLLLPACARTTGVAGGAPPSAVPATPGSRAPSTASATATYRVGRRQVEFTDQSRVTDPNPGQPGNKTQGRTLPTTIWYPAAPARGPFPVILFSHGLLGLPADYQAIATRWASAGFVVVAPTYPLTSRASPHVQPLDVPNQPADASFVLTSVLRLAERPSDPLHGMLDSSRIAAAGHSAGAITTVGLFTTCCRDARILAGIVLAGNSLGFTNHFAGRPVPMLFEHGDTTHSSPTGPAACCGTGCPGQRRSSPYKVKATSTRISCPPALASPLWRQRRRTSSAGRFPATRWRGTTSASTPVCPTWRVSTTSYSAPLVSAARGR
jgi:dienelactone hydrolase